MLPTDVTALAELLAAHAVVLLGVGIGIAILVLLGILLAVRALVRLEHPLRDALVRTIYRARDVAASSVLWRRAGILLPSGLLAVHLLLGLVLTMVVVAFAGIAEEVAGGGELAAFDLAFAQALQRETTAPWRDVFGVVSWLGAAPVLALASGIVALVLFRQRRPMLAVVWIVAQAGGGLLNLGLKELFSRTRPELAEPLAVTGWSFPSGHAMGTFIFCGLGAYILVRRRRSWTAAALIVTAALLWCVVMSFSRLYLGVHYASDVVAGMIAGAGWVVVCVSGVELVLKRESRRAMAAAAGVASGELVHGMRPPGPDAKRQSESAAGARARRRR